MTSFSWLVQNLVWLIHLFETLTYAGVYGKFFGRKKGIHKEKPFVIRPLFRNCSNIYVC